jgi:hypothetical protein
MLSSSLRRSSIFRRKCFLNGSAAVLEKSKNVFLIFGDDREAEMDMTLRLFREMGATDWCSNTLGAWEAFVKKASDPATGIVIVSSPFHSLLHWC